MARVLIVGRGAPERGGIRTTMETLLSCDLTRRHQLSYLNLGRARGPEGGKVSVSNTVRTLRDLAALWKHSRGMHVVHIHTAFAPTSTVVRAGVLALAARIRGAAPLIHLHGGRFPAWVESPRSRRLVRAVAAVVDRFAVVSHRSAEALAEVIGTSKVHLVANGVNVARFRPGREESGPPAILYVGVLSPRKGLVDLFEASRQLRERRVEHRLWVVGGVPDEGTQASQEVRRAAPEWVEFLGELGDALPGVYASAAVFCLPSWWEASPMTLMEAAAAGLPSVATRVGDVPLMVEEGHTGLLVEPREPEALAAALQELLGSPQRRAEMGSRARSRAEEAFGAARMVDELDHIYREGVR